MSALGNDRAAPTDVRLRRIFESIMALPSAAPWTSAAAPPAAAAVPPFNAPRTEAPAPAAAAADAGGAPTPLMHDPAPAAAGAPEATPFLHGAGPSHRLPFSGQQVPYFAHHQSPMYGSGYQYSGGYPMHGGFDFHEPVEELLRRPGVEEWPPAYANVGTGTFARPAMRTSGGVMSVTPNAGMATSTRGAVGAPSATPSRARPRGFAPHRV
eukprot:scaffold9350_cov105-Isochrysis_galbana.AAC.4